MIFIFVTSFSYFYVQSLMGHSGMIFEDGDVKVCELLIIELRICYGLVDAIYTKYIMV